MVLRICKVLAGVVLIGQALPAAADVSVKNMKGGGREIKISTGVEQKGDWKYIAMVTLEHAKKSEPAKASFTIARVDPPTSYDAEPWPWRLCPAAKLRIADQEARGVETFPPSFNFLKGDSREAIYWIEVDRETFEKASLARDVSLKVCDDVVSLPARFQLDMRKAIDMYRLN